jgi:hypothetical protein
MLMKSFSVTMHVSSRCRERLWIHLHGQPQYLRNKTTTGRPSTEGNGSLGLVCALSPMIGGSRTGAGGGGACHDEKAFGGHVMFAKGLAMPAPAPSPPPSCAPFGLPAKGLSLGKEMPPNPALCNAILVPILFRKDIVAVIAYAFAILVGVRWVV